MVIVKKVNLQAHDRAHGFHQIQRISIDYSFNNSKRFCHRIRALSLMENKSNSKFGTLLSKDDLEQSQPVAPASKGH
ncbi:hypothetical protein LXL04_007114 [Taraxacum kok-saghyz]